MRTRISKGRGRWPVKQYVFEFNRTRGDSIRTAKRRLERWGFEVDIIVHKTSIKALRPSGISWEEFEDATRDALDPIRGSALIFSQSSGCAWICSMTANQQGVFQEITNDDLAA